VKQKLDKEWHVKKSRGEANNMNATEYALTTTAREIEDGYRELRRHLVGNNAIYAVRAALGLAKIDAAALWKFLKNFAIEEVNHRETNHLLVLDALYNSWVQNPTNPAFIAQAVATLANLTKVNGESVMKFFPNHKY
jgi:hypothetical protein